MKIPPKVFFACKHFGTGVLIATAFVHLLPTAFASLTDPCLPDLFTVNYPPMPGVIMMTAMFCLFVVEMWLNGKMGGEGHSHGGPMGFETPVVVRSAPPQRPRRPDSADSTNTMAFEKQLAQKEYEERQRSANIPNPFESRDDTMADGSEMPTWFIVFYEQYVRQRLEMLNLIGAADPSTTTAKSTATTKSSAAVKTRSVYDAETALPEGWFLDEDGNATDPLVYKKLSLNITLLEGGILFHSVFVGMTISITIDGFIILLVAILFHQMFEGLGLGSRIAAVPYPKGSWRAWILVFAFGTTAPIGQAIGLLTRSSYDPNSAFGLIIVGVFNAMYVPHAFSGRPRLVLMPSQFVWPVAIRCSGGPAG